MTFHGIRSLLVAAMVVASSACEARAELAKIVDFTGLVLWAGSGTNSAAFVLQFSGTTETPTSVAWGYRWSGTATMQAMTNAIAGTTTLVNGAAVSPGLDSRLSIAGTQYAFGTFLSEIAYDQTGLPVGWSQTTRQIMDNWINDGTYPVLYTRPNAGGLWLGAGESQTMTFDYAAVGASDIELTPGGWYGFAQADGAEAFGFSQPVAAVPEPSSMALLACAGVVVGVGTWRRRRVRAA